MTMSKLGVSGSASASVGAGSSANRAGAARRAGGGPGGWHPTILYMGGLIIGEILVVAWLSRHLLR